MSQYSSTFDSLAEEAQSQAQRRVLPALFLQVHGLSLEKLRWVTLLCGWTGVEMNACKFLQPAVICVAARAAGEISDRFDQVVGDVGPGHAFCIVHEDMVDQDQQRRACPAVWTQFGSLAVLLCSDSALALTCLDEAALVGRLCGAVEETSRGEALDVECEQRRDLSTEEYLQMSELRVGALKNATYALCAAAAGGSLELVGRMDRFGRCLGLVFRISDDLLGMGGDPEAIGKPVSVALRRRSRTYPVVLAALTCLDLATHPLPALGGSAGPVGDEQVAKCAHTIAQLGVSDVSRTVALVVLAHAEGHFGGCGIDVQQTAPLRPSGATRVDGAS